MLLDKMINIVINLGDINMNFDQTMLAAAKAAERSVKYTMHEYSSGRITDEDDLTPALAGSLGQTFSDRIGGLAMVRVHRKASSRHCGRGGSDRR